MYHRKVLLWMLDLGLVLLLLSACATPQPTAPPPTATPEPPPTATVTPEPSVWDYVAMGDFVVAQLGDYAYSTHYAAYLEADLGVKVMLHPKVQGDWLSAELLDSIRNDQALRDNLSQAEVVTLYIGGVDLWRALQLQYQIGTCGGDDNLDCAREACKTVKVNYDAILDELLALCAPGTLIRAATYYSFLGPYGYDENVIAFYSYLNEQIIQSAAEHNIPVAQVDIAFHGPAEDENAADKGYVLGAFPSKEGAKVIADAHRELGYEPTVP